MLHLRLKTEYSFKKAFGTIDNVLDVIGNAPAVAITDNGTWGHIQFHAKCNKRGIKPILGVEILTVQDADLRERQTGPSTTFLAKNLDGLKEIYNLVTISNELFYYVPRIDYRHVIEASESGNIIILSGTNADLKKLPKNENVLLELNSDSLAWNRKATASGRQCVVSPGNFFPLPGDRPKYEIHCGRDARSRTGAQHILSEAEAWLEIPHLEQKHIDLTYSLAEQVEKFDLPNAEMIHMDWDSTIRELCEDGKHKKFNGKWTPEYEERLQYELGLIEEKEFSDYFLLVADIVGAAKKEMFVGPARGSSAGSIVCYLLDITEVDPIKHGLMFERFIDITRSDLPDIDIDFPDKKRDRVIEIMREKYGASRVAHLGTVLRYKPRSAIGEVAKAIGIPPWETEDLKEAIVERSSGDARAQYAVSDTFESLDLAKDLLKKYPGLSFAGALEGHAKYSGKNAAGLLVTDDDIVNYCGIAKDNVAQLDKKDAEKINALKIDILGLRTLSVLEDALEQIGKTPDFLLNYPLDDQEAFDVINDERFTGIFQFEGYALQALTKQMGVHRFEDIVAITSLARPGPLHCGAAIEFVLRRVGDQPVRYLHDIAKDITSDTFGTVIFQEQVMLISREIGNLNWEDVNQLRRAMSKSLGDEFFDKYWVKFRDGAINKNGLPEVEARKIWDNICTFGSWAFNKSHAVSYGLISYWCAVLKAHWPLEFTAATLRNAKDEEQSTKILRDIVRQGYEFVPYDAERSLEDWSVKDGLLIGGFMNIKGIGPKKSADILARRDAGEKMTPGALKLLMSGETPYDDIFEGERRFGEYYTKPEKFKVLSGGVKHIQDIEAVVGDYVFLGKIKEKNLRDMNEQHSLAKRGGRMIKRNSVFLHMILEDDTGQIIAKINRWDYPTMGKPILERAKIGDWFLWKGHIDSRWRIVTINKCRWLEDRNV